MTWLPQLQVLLLRVTVFQALLWSSCLGMTKAPVVLPQSAIIQKTSGQNLAWHLCQVGVTSQGHWAVTKDKGTPRRHGGGRALGAKVPCGGWLFWKGSSGAAPREHGRRAPELRGIERCQSWGCRGWFCVFSPFSTGWSHRAAMLGCYQADQHFSCFKIPVVFGVSSSTKTGHCGSDSGQPRDEAFAPTGASSWSLGKEGCMHPPSP